MRRPKRLAVMQFGWACDAVPTNRLFRFKQTFALSAPVRIHMFITFMTRWLKQQYLKRSHQAKREKAEIFSQKESIEESEFHGDTTWALQNTSAVMQTRKGSFGPKAGRAGGARGKLGSMVVRGSMGVAVVIDFLKGVMGDAVQCA